MIVQAVTECDSGVSAIRQRLLLHNVSIDEHRSIEAALAGRHDLRLDYNHGNLELRTASGAAQEIDAPIEQHLLLTDISWQQYVELGHALGRRHLRATYSSGSLELMTLSPEHEGQENVLRLLIQVLAEEHNVVIKNLGSTTFQREDLERGLEPDACFYTTNFAAIRGKARIDLSVDPPPDLAVEVDVTRSSLDRMEIYARLGVPELWRYEGQQLNIYRLEAGAVYAQCERSITFPQVAPADLARFIQQGDREDDVAILRSFREWVRQQAAQA